MVLSVASVAFATGEKITVSTSSTTASLDGKSFSAYKIFDAHYTADGTGVNYTIAADSVWFTDTVAKGVLDTYFDFAVSAADSSTYNVTPKTGKMADGTDARKLTDALTNKIPSTATATTATGSGSSAVLDVGETGYFLIIGAMKPADPKNGTDEVKTAYALISVKDGNAAIKAKADVPDLDKKITAVYEGSTAIAADKLDTDGKAAAAKVGSKVEFEITSAVPDITGYSAYTFTFTDTMTSGLTNNKDIAIYINGSDTAFTGTVNKTETDRGFTLTFPYDTLKTMTAGQSISIKYNATVNSTALTYDFEKNTAKLTYSNNPGDTTTNDTPDKDTYVVDIKVDVNKYTGTDASTGTKLAGAKFKLYRAADEFYKWDANNGKVTWVAEASADIFTTVDGGALDKQIKGLDLGTYHLKEIKAPDGYNLMASDIDFTISATYSGTNKTITYSSTVGTVDATTNPIDLTAQHTAEPKVTIDVLNKAGTELPSTGGIGTTIFYIAGLVLVLGAAAVIIARRKAEQN